MDAPVPQCPQVGGLVVEVVEVVEVAEGLLASMPGRAIDWKAVTDKGFRAMTVFAIARLLQLSR